MLVLLWKVPDVKLWLMYCLMCRHSTPNQCSASIGNAKGCCAAGGEGGVSRNLCARQGERHRGWRADDVNGGDPIREQRPRRRESSLHDRWLVEYEEDWVITTWED
jgi:hypothetical protein